MANANKRQRIIHLAQVSWCMVLTCISSTQLWFDWQAFVQCAYLLLPHSIAIRKSLGFRLNIWPFMWSSCRAFVFRRKTNSRCLAAWWLQWMPFTYSVVVFCLLLRLYRAGSKRINYKPKYPNSAIDPITPEWIFKRFVVFLDEDRLVKSGNIHFN